MSRKPCTNRSMECGTPRSAGIGPRAVELNRSPGAFMDLYKTIAELRARRDQLARIIEQLESLQSNPETPSSKRRGRKFMGPKERAEVSKRMKQYWASRAKRQQRD